jgi:uncharacterized protein (TIGR00304 family)
MDARPIRWLSPAMLLAGAALIGYAVERHAASLVLVVIIPVVTGSSLAFLGGVLLLFLGLATLPWAFAADEEDRRMQSRPRAGATGTGSGGGSGGVVVVGPFPIFFGSWRQPSRAVYWLAVALALAFFILFVALFWPVR